MVLVEDAHGAPLRATDRTRTVPTWMQRALRERDHHCRFPGCRHRRWVEAHHLVHWADGGPTVLENLALLCTRHHTYVHERAIRITMGAHQRPEFFDARGTPIPHRVAPPRGNAEASARAVM